MHRIYLLILLALLYFPALSESAKKEKQFVIQNKSIQRVFEIKGGAFYTSLFKLKENKSNFISPNSIEETEFSFLLNGKMISGKTGWEVENVISKEEKETGLLEFTLKGTSELNKTLRLKITYITYSNLPIIRKKIAFENIGTHEFQIEALNIEELKTAWSATYNVTYQKYGRYRHLGPFMGDWDDPLVLVHDESKKRGFVLGNEVPGVLKRTTSFLDGRKITSGLTHPNQQYPFGVWIEPAEKWESPWVFTGLYVNNNPRAVIDETVSDFVRNYMGIRLNEIPVKPTFVYNTWKPFRRDVNEKLVKELADAAADCGIEEFIIDDGWQVGFGDWEIDYEKFPNGLKPVFEYVKSKGMKPGLWLSMGAASKNSKVYAEHPEWFVKYKDGEHTNLHTGSETDRYSACFTTGWKDYIKDKILGLVKEHGLEYVKLDFAIAASAYRYGGDVSGCYAENHSHKDRQESFLEIYRSAWQMFDELHDAAPNLFIDCTFETMGALQMVDYDMCKHAEGNWLSNFYDEAPVGSERVRQMAWWRAPVIPATALVIGNQSLEDEHSLYSYKSLAGTLPIMLGDPRKMSVEKRRQFKEISGWLRAMENKHGIMLFRQDLPGFGEPTHGSWDGFQRINTESKSGGIIGVFKQFSKVSEQWVTVNHLDSEKNYVVVHASTGRIILKATGDELKNKGFKVVFDAEFQG
ncbi:MAG: alpha-galactosidase, partial [Bacteroidetes bacterium]|nr:alpha-galactosidase [Bacteroidota bacterium]